MAYDILELKAILDLAGGRKAKSELQDVQAEAVKTARVLDAIDDSGSGFTRLERALDALESDLQDTQRTAARGINVDTDTSGIERGTASVNNFERTIRDASGQTLRADADFDDAAARSGVTSFVSFIAGADPTLTANAEFDDAAASAGIATFLGELRAVDGQKATVTGDADTAGGSTKLTAFQELVNTIDGDNMLVTADADTGAAGANLNMLMALMSQVDGRQLNSNVDVDTAAGTSALLAFQALSSSLDGDDIHQNVDVDAAGAITELGAYSASSAAAKGSTELMSGSLSGSTLVWTGLAAAVALAAAALVPALGGIAAVGAAGAGAAAGLGLIGAATYVMVQGLYDGGAAFSALSAAASSTWQQMIQAVGPVGDTIAQVGIAALDVANQYIPLLGPVTQATATAMQAAFQRFFDFLSTGGAGFSFITRILGGINDITGNLTNTFVSLGEALIAILAAATPAAVGLSGAIAGIAASFAEWATSAQGQAQITAAIQSAIPVFQALWDAVVQIGGALLNFSVAAAPAVTGAFMILGTAITGFINALTWLIQQVGVAPVAFGVLAVAVGLVAVALAPVVAAIAASLPLFAGAIVAVGALAAAATLIYQNWGTVAPFLQGVWEAISAGAEAAWSTIVPVIETALSAVLSLVQSVGGQISDWWAQNGAQVTALISQTWQEIQSIVATMAPIIVQLVTSTFSAMGTVVSGVWTAISGIVQGSVDVLLGIITVFTGFLTGDWDMAWSGLGQIVQGAMTAVGAVAQGGLTVVQGIIQWFTAILTALWQTAWAALGPIVMPILQAIATAITTSLTAISLLFTTIFTAISTAVTAAFTTISLVVTTGLTLLVTTITTLLTPLVVLFTTIWNAIVVVVQTVLTVLLTVIIVTLALIVGTIALALEGLITVFTTAFTAISTVVTTILTALSVAIAAIWQAIYDTVSPIVQALWDGITAIFNAGVAAVSAVLQTVQEVASSAWQAVYDAVSPIVQAIWDFVVQAWTAMQENTSTTFNAISEIASTVWNAISAVITPIVQAIWDFIVQAWTAIQETTSSVFQAVSDFMSSTWQAIYDTVAPIVQSIVDAISVAWDTVSSYTTSIYDAVSTYLSDTWNTISTTVSDLVQTIVDYISEAWDTVSSYTTEIYDQVASYLSDTWNSIYDTVSGILDSIAEYISTTWDAIVTGVEGFATAFGDAVYNAFSTAVNKGLDILAGLLQAMSDALTGLGVDDLGTGAAAESILGYKFEKGGVVGYARGGMGTSGRNPRMHVWNEGMGGEAYIAEKGPRRAQMSYAEQAANWFGGTVLWGGGQDYAAGGMVRNFCDGGCAHASGGYVSSSCNCAQNGAMVAEFVRGGFRPGPSRGFHPGPGRNFHPGPGRIVTGTGGQNISNVQQSQPTEGEYKLEIHEGNWGTTGGSVPAASAAGASQGATDAGAAKPVAKAAAAGAAKGAEQASTDTAQPTTVNVSRHDTYSFHETFRNEEIPRYFEWLPGDTEGVTTSHNAAGALYDAMAFKRGAAVHRGDAANTHITDPLGSVIGDDLNLDTNNPVDPNYAQEMIKAGGARAFERAMAEGTGPGYVSGSGEDWSQPHWSVEPYIQERADEIAARFGTPWNTYVTHGTQGGSWETVTVDFWGPGGQGSPIDPGTGQAVADYVISNYGSDLMYLIAQGSMYRGGWFAFPEDPHYDHTHVSWGGSGGGPGGIVCRAVKALFQKAADTAKEAAKGLLSGIEVPGIKGISEWGIDTGIQSVIDWIIEQLPSCAGGSGGGGGGTGSCFDQLPAALEQAGYGPEYEQPTRDIIQRESGGDPSVDNTEGSGAAGCGQFMPSTFANFSGECTDIYDPLCNVMAMLRYQDSLGGPGNYYADGGVIPGPAGAGRMVWAHAGERVLPRSLATAFDNLATSVSAGGALGNGINPGAGAPAGIGARSNITIQQDFSGMQVGGEITPDEIKELAYAGGIEGANDALTYMGSKRRQHSGRIASRRT